MCRRQNGRRIRLEIVGYRSVEAAALAELQRADADPAAVSEFVDFVEQVHYIETHPDRARASHRNISLHSEVKGFIRWKLLGVGEASAQAIPV